MPFERFEPVRRGRAPQQGEWVRLTIVNGKVTTFRITRGALALIGITPTRGDHHYFVVEVDRESGALRLTPTTNVALGRLMNPVNRQIHVGRAFGEWTGWGESRWAVRAEGGSLVGDEREVLDVAIRIEAGA